ncbi:hypothetical protein [Clostridium sp.]|uniref:hypothetical protein n=1 Tax=Clostridium sp. TaxID=1506 RepID=UPI0025BACFA9|nr:hypothetical protein [Clostridium sp.]
MENSAVSILDVSLQIGITPNKKNNKYRIFFQNTYLITIICFGPAPIEETGNSFFFLFVINVFDGTR